jgi:hypothetical protein
MYNKGGRPTFNTLGSPPFLGVHFFGGTPDPFVFADWTTKAISFSLSFLHRIKPRAFLFIYYNKLTSVNRAHLNR